MKPKNAIASCPVCGNPAPCPPFADPKGREYSRCPRCGLYFLLHRYRPSPEEERKRYLLHDNSAANEEYLSYLGRIVDTAVFPFVRPGGSILDIGSGPDGVLVGLLRERGYPALGHDPFFSPDPPPDGMAFSAVTLIEVVEHAGEPRQLMTDAVRYLGGRSGGILIVKTLFAPDSGDAFLSWWYRQDITHILFYQRKTLTALAEGSGFRLLWSDNESIAVFGLR